MPAQSQQQQKLFGLALAFKRGEVKSSEVSDEIKGIADRMSEKEIEDFAKTTHKGLPKMKEQLRKIVREIMREKAISEMNEVSINESASKEAMGIAALTGTRGSAVEDFINKHELDGKKLFRSIKKANLRGRLNFASALAGKDGNPNQKLTIKLHKKNESVINEGTRSQVGVIGRNGKIVSAYVHYDGYPSNMKPGLKKHMKSDKDVLKLIKMGGARGIFDDKEIEYYKSGKPTKGDMKDFGKYVDTADRSGGAEYIYLYNMKDKKWYFADVYGDKKLKKLF